MPLGPTQQYLAKFNNYVLPGYVQNESFDSLLNTAAHYGPYIDGSLTEDTGLQNKQLTLTLKVWETDYLTCKQQVELAATYLRSYRTGFANLYVQFPDKHYSAMVKSVKTDKTAGTSVRTLEYQVEFECKPWLYGETLHQLTGTGTVDTDQVSRDINSGGWTPTIVTITGTGNVGINGYTNDSQFVGGFVTENSVSNLVVDTEAFTATISGGLINANASMFTKDYRLYVGPGKTTFTTTNASSCTIEYFDRWYI